MYCECPQTNTIFTLESLLVLTVHGTILGILKEGNAAFLEALADISLKFSMQGSHGRARKHADEIRVGQSSFVAAARATIFGKTLIDGVVVGEKREILNVRRETVIE